MTKDGHGFDADGLQTSSELTNAMLYVDYGGRRAV